MDENNALARLNPAAIVAEIIEPRESRRRTHPDPPTLDAMNARLMLVELRLGDLLGGCNYVDLCKLTQIVGRMGALVEDLRARRGSHVVLSGQVGLLQTELARLKPIVEMLQRELRGRLPDDAPGWGSK